MIDYQYRYLRTIIPFFVVFGILVLAARGWAFQDGQTASLDASPPSNVSDIEIPFSSGDLVADLDRGRPQANEVDKMVEAIVNRQPIDDRLFLIGPRPAPKEAGKPGDPAEELRSTDGEGQPDLDAATAAGAESGETVLENNWVQMDLDKDGTYLFLGEGAEEDETLNDSDMLDLDDIGVGIGKKWHF